MQRWRLFLNYSIGQTHGWNNNICVYLFLYSSFLVWCLLPIRCRCRCRGLWLHLITLDTQKHTLDRTPPNEGSARRRDLYLTQDIHKRQTSMLPAGLEPTIPASEWPQTYALDRAATGIGCVCISFPHEIHVGNRLDGETGSPDIDMSLAVSFTWLWQVSRDPYPPHVYHQMPIGLPAPWCSVSSHATSGSDGKIGCS